MTVNNVSFLILGIVGLLIQGFGTALLMISEKSRDDNVFGIAVALVILGPVMLAIGSAMYAAGKGRKPLYGLLGLLSPVGLLFLAVLEDRRSAAEN